MENNYNKQEAHFKSPIISLKEMISDPDFTNDVVGVSVLHLENQIVQITNQFSKQVIKQLDDLKRSTLRETLGVDTDEDARKKLGSKEWANKFKNLQNIIYGKEELSLEDAEGKILKNILDKNTDENTKEEIKSLEKEILEKRKEAEKAIEILKKDLNNPEMINKATKAFELWGISPDSLGNKGINNKGYNAGLIHYFEYRANKEKGGRYAYYHNLFSIDDFYNYTTELFDDLNSLENGKINNHTSIGRLLKDDFGNKKYFMLRKDNALVIGYKNNKELMPKLITIIPKQDPNDLNNAVEDLLKNGESSERLNKMNGKITEIPLN